MKTLITLALFATTVSLCEAQTAPTVTVTRVDKFACSVISQATRTPCTPYAIVFVTSPNMSLKAFELTVDKIDAAGVRSTRTMLLPSFQSDGSMFSVVSISGDESVFTNPVARGLAYATN